MAATVKKSMNTTDPFQSGRNLPLALILEILSRLPVKSLLRFRCVSKEWLALVDSDDHFARSHLKNFKNNRDETRLIVEQVRGPIQECVIRRSDTFEPVSEIIPSNRWNMVSSLDGLILLRYTATGGQFRNLKVWNPSIRRFLQVPPLLKSDIKLSSSTSLWDVDVGLGYDSVANSYKVVKLIHVNDTLHSVAIYVLGADSWRIIDKGLNWHWTDLYASGGAVYSQSGLYFISNDNHDDKVWDLVHFDLSKEVFSSIRMPEIHHSDGGSPTDWWSPTVISFDGGSSLVALNGHPRELYTFALDRESMRWTKLQVYSLDKYPLLHIKKNGDLLICLCDESEDSHEVTSMNRETGELKTLQQPADSVIEPIYCYVESLIMHR